MAKIKTSKTGKPSKAGAPKAADKAPGVEINGAAESTLQTLDPRMVSGLLCPKTRTALVFDREANELISKKAKLAYPIREGVPIMLIEEARKL